EPRAHQEFILVDGIKGLPIRGNSFTLDAAIANDFVGARKGYGILSWDSDIIVEPHEVVIDDPDPTLNVFNNNWIGIYSKPMGEVNNNFIDQCIFNNNHIGVAFDGSANFGTIINNDFNIPEALGTLEDANMGIYIESATSLSIENNDFDGLAQTSGGSNGGIYISNGSLLGSGSSEIYRNNFNRLDVIIQSDGDNLETNVDCNDFDNDLSGGNQILWHNTIFSEVKQQGSCPVPPGTLPEEPQANRFLGTYGFPNFTILNEGCTFEYNSYNVTDYILSTDVGADDQACIGEIAINPLLACPAHSESPDVPGFIIEIGVLHELNDDLFGPIDGGNTEELVDMIENTSSSVTIRNNLLDESPYLSDEVLIAMIDKPGMQESKAKQVLEANAPLTTNVLLALMASLNNYSTSMVKKLILQSGPVRDEAVLVAAIDRVPELSSASLKKILVDNSPLRDETLLAMLNRQTPMGNAQIRDVLKINTPLSQDVDAVFVANNYPASVNDKVNGSGVEAGNPNDKNAPTSVVEEILNEISYNNSKILSIVDRLVRFYLSENDFVSAVLLLEEENTVQASCALVPILLETRDGTRFYDHIQRIRDEAGADLELFVLCDYYELMFEIRGQPGGIEAITQIQIDLLNEIANGNSAMVANTENVLEYIGSRSINELHMQNINFGPINKAPEGSYTPEVIEEEEKVQELLIYPNPTESVLNVRYSQPNSENSVYLYVFNLTGQTLYSRALEARSGEIVVDVSNFTPGVYLVSIISDDADQLVEKLIIR
ncbi:T9SS type A sorting domain-containing protein, partial [Crocinitomix catalasitica]|nr:T9SS type A sorting domain-containing protein [Crocinitomix catalasitica]